MTFIKDIWHNFVSCGIKSWGSLPVWSQVGVPYMNPLVSWNSVISISTWLQDLCTKYCVGIVLAVIFILFCKKLLSIIPWTPRFGLFSLINWHLWSWQEWIRYRGPVIFNKHLAEGFNHTVSASVNQWVKVSSMIHCIFVTLCGKLV